MNATAASGLKRVVLLGGGHSQVQVIEDFARDAPPHAAVVLVNRSRLTPYSGMLPGLIAGHYRHAECHIDLARLCERAGVTFLEQEATAIDLAGRYVHCSDGGRHAYDILSIDTGSTPPLDAVPGARAHAVGVKPIEPFLLEIERLIAAADQPAMTLAVVGAGAAGVEVILALDHRFRQRLGARPRPALHLLTDAAHILAGFNAQVRRAAERILVARGIEIHTHAAVTAVDAGGLTLRSGQRLPADRTLFVNGAAPDAQFARAGLQTDARGFIVVNAALQSVSHPNVFASGDVAAVLEHPRPKAGVFAVRQGPPLARNLRCMLRGDALHAFTPQEKFLVLLSAGDKYAIATRGNWKLEGRWVWRCKDWIDRRFVARF